MLFLARFLQRRKEKKSLIIMSLRILRRYRHGKPWKFKESQGIWTHHSRAKNRKGSNITAHGRHRALRVTSNENQRQIKVLELKEKNGKILRNEDSKTRRTLTNQNERTLIITWAVVLLRVQEINKQQQNKTSNYMILLVQYAINHE